MSVLRFFAPTSPVADVLAGGVGALCTVTFAPSWSLSKLEIATAVPAARSLTARDIVVGGKLGDVVQFHGVAA